jgi:hypothetical protein
MNRAVTLIGMLAMAGLGCDDNNNNMIIVHDMAMRMGQDANMGVPIGGQCSLTSDCKTGTNPTCAKKRNNKTGECSADCTTDADCGDGNICLFAPQSSTDPAGACAKSCQAATDCGDGLGCWVSLGATTFACWPVDGIAQGGKALTLDCDPTVAGCTFTGSPLPGGCQRQILGTGNGGHCIQGCDIGVGTCPDLSAMDKQACYFLDETVDSTGMATGDKLKQGICGFALPVAADGASCVDTTGAGPFYNVCQIGSECDLFKTATNANPDMKCHKLCYLGNFTPPDGGALFNDGGVAMGCTTGTCTDVFGVGNSPTPPTMPVGLCK